MPPVNPRKVNSMSVSEYEQAKLNDYKDARRESLESVVEYEKAQIDALYNYKISKLNAENALTTKLIKQKVALQAKYGLIDNEGNPKKVEAAIEKKYKKELAEYEKFAKAKAKIDEKIAKNALSKELAQAKSLGASTIRNGSILNWQTWASFKSATTGLSGGQKTAAVLDGLVSGLSDFAKKLDSTIDTIGSYKSRWDTRLYGYSGTNYESITKTVTGGAGVSPYVKQTDIMKNIDSLIEQGIAYNVEQRAFLQTISDKIATTFDAANGTLLQLVRIQQADSTASRLGLEAGVTSYLNNMFSNSEYMSSLYKSVLSNIYEATSQYNATDSIGFEYQVQKWLGSLYSLGLSSSAVQNISSSLGALGSGNLAGLSSGMQNLLVMSASRMGLSYSDLLTGGLSASKTNDLMYGLVSYLSEIANNNNNIVKSQYANIFGLSLSDLKAISNVGSSLSNIYNSNMDYASSMGTLSSMANSLASRVSMGELMGNLWDNTQYSMASGIAANPALYAIYKASGLLDAVAGGIELPDIKYLGTGINLQTSVADLMRVGALSGGILSSIASMLVSGGNGGLTGSGLLEAFGIKGTTTVSRGSGYTFTDAGVSTSLSNYIANASGDDIQNSYVNQSENEASKKLQILKQEEESDSTKLSTVDDHIVQIYELLQSGITVRWAEVLPQATSTPEGDAQF